MSQSSGPSRHERTASVPTEDLLRRAKRNPEMKVLSDIEKELEEIHQQIDRIEEMLRKAFKDNAA